MNLDTYTETQYFSFTPNKEIKAKNKSKWKDGGKSRDKKRYKKKHQRFNKWEDGL